MCLKHPCFLLVLGLIWACRAGESADSEHRPTYVLDIDDDKTQTLACGLTVPKIKDARGYPHGSVGLRRSHPCDDDRSDVINLWRADQFVAAWRDPGTNVVTLLRLSYPFPNHLQPGQRLPANTYFRDARVLAAIGYPTVAAEHIQDWLNFYYRRGAADAGPLQMVSIVAWMEAVGECDRFKMEAGGKPCLVYVFKLKALPNAPRPLNLWFALEVRSERECDDEQEAFAKKFLRGVTVNPDAFVAENDYWRKEPFDTFARANAIRGVRSQGGEWEIFHRGNFSLITDNADAQACAEEGLEAQQKAYDLFHTVLFPFGPAALDDVCVIRVYATGWEFEDSGPRTRKWAGGMYLPGSDEIVMRGWSPEGTQHEVMHRYLHIANGKQGLSTWFDEGFACYAGGCKVVEDGRLAAQPVPNDSLLFALVEKGDLGTVERVFTETDFYHEKELERNPKDKAALLGIAKNYASAWGIIYFLREAPPFYSGKGYETLIPLYWETLQQTGDPEEATRAVLAKLKMADFLADFRSYFLRFAADDEATRKEHRRRLRPAYGGEHDEFLPRERRFDFTTLLLGNEETPKHEMTDGDRAESGADEADTFRTVRHGAGTASASRAAARNKRDHGKTAERKNGRTETRDKSGKGGTSGTDVVVVLTLGLAFAWGWFRFGGGKFFVLAVALTAGGVFGEVAETNGYTFSYHEVEGGVVIGDGTACAVDPAPDGEFEIPSNLGGGTVIAISAYAFAECEEMTTLTLPKSVEVIGDCAFYDCRSLESVTLPDSTTEIGTGAFFLCSHLREIAIPPQVKVIPEWAFARCFRLSKLTMGDAVGVIGDDAFLGCAALTEIELPNSVTLIGERAFKWCSGLKKVAIKGRVLVVGYELFAGCSALNDLSLPPTVTVIGEGAFMWCASLENLHFPGSVTRIGSHAFYGCRRLVSVHIPDTVGEIGNDAFGECLGLKQVELGNARTVIGHRTFSRCPALPPFAFPGQQ